MEIALRVLVSTALIAFGLTVTGLGAATAVGELDLKSANKLLIEIFGKETNTFVVHKKTCYPQVVPHYVFVNEI